MPLSTGKMLYQLRRHNDYSIKKTLFNHQLDLNRNNQIFPKFLDMMSLTLNYYLMKKNPYVLILKFEYIAIFLNRPLLFKEINILYKWQRPSSPLKYFLY